MLHSRWARRSAVVFAASLMALAGLAGPASADPGEVTAELTPHCTYGRLVITNNTGAAIEGRALVDGVATDWITIDPPPYPGGPPAIRLPLPSGQEVQPQWRQPGGAATNIGGPLSNGMPDRCDDFAVTFTDSCDSTAVSITNNHGEDVHLIVRGPDLGTIVYNDPLVVGTPFTDVIPMVAGGKVWVDVQVGRLIDQIAEHEFVATGCAPAPDYPTTVVDTCDGVKVTVTNDSDEPLPVQVYRGDEVDPALVFEVAAGATKSVEVEVEAGVEVFVGSAENKLNLAEHTAARPGDCDEPALPTTGTDVMTIALAGLGVLVAGAAVLFVLNLRRRKLTQQ